MVQKLSKKTDLKVAFFFNSIRGLTVLNSLRNKINVKYIFLAKKNLVEKVAKNITEKFSIISSLNDPNIFKILKREKINLIISAGFPYIFGKKFFKKRNKVDILNLHGGPVPRFKGGSPLIWQKIEGRKKIGISIIKVDKGIDSGKLMGIKFFKIKDEDDIKVIQDKSIKLFCVLLWEVIQKYYLNKKIKLNTKRLFPSKYYSQRKPGDSLVNLETMNSKKVYNFYKALVPRYEEPFLYFGENKVSLKEIEITSKKTNKKIGLVEKYKDKYFLNLQDKKIRLVQTSFDLKKIQNKFLTSEKLPKDIWLKKVLKINCYKTENEKYINTFKNYKKSLIFLKTEKAINKKELADSNLRYLGMNIMYHLDVKLIGNYTKKKDITYKTNPNKPERKAVADIAYKNFNYSRFHLDNRLSSSKSNLIKKKTIENYFLRQRGDKVFVQFYQKKISGFCLLKYEDYNVTRIELICIDKKFARKGLATDLLRFSLGDLKKKTDSKKIIVSTQEKNIASTRLYDSFNFLTKSKFFLYHYIS